MNSVNLDKPVVLIRHRLDWEHATSEYRLIAFPVEYGFYGIEFVTEKLDGLDAMGEERWVPTESTETSLVIASISQYILYQKYKKIR